MFTPAGYAAVAALVISALAVTTQTVKLALARADLQAEKLARAEDVGRLQAAAREQAEQFRSTEQAWSKAQQENSRVAEKARSLAEQHAAAAGVAADGLRGRVAVLAATCRGPARSAPAVAAGPAASAPGDLLAHVLGRIDQAAGELARYADAAAVAGEQCAADYQALRLAATPDP